MIKKHNENATVLINDIARLKELCKQQGLQADICWYWDGWMRCGVIYLEGDTTPEDEKFRARWRRNTAAWYVIEDAKFETTRRGTPKHKAILATITYLEERAKHLAGDCFYAYVSHYDGVIWGVGRTLNEAAANALEYVLDGTLNGLEWHYCTTRLYEKVTRGGACSYSWLHVGDMRLMTTSDDERLEQADKAEAVA